MAKSRNVSKKTADNKPSTRTASRNTSRKKASSTRKSKSTASKKTTHSQQPKGHAKKKTTTHSKPLPKGSTLRTPQPQQSRPLTKLPPRLATPSEKIESKPEPANQQFEERVNIKLDQSVAILIDGNNIEMSLHAVSKKTSSMINFDKLVPVLLNNRALSRLIYFREGKSISQKLAERLQKMFHGSVVPCHKSADIPLSIKAVQVASKVDTVIILSGDADYVELVRHLKHDGIRVEIAAFPETTADILRQESDYFFPITVDYSFALK